MSKFENMFLGFVIGDSMGTPVKGLTREELINKPVLKMEKYPKLDNLKGCFSTNTSVLLCTIDSFNRMHKFEYRDIMNTLDNYLVFGGFTPTNKTFDPSIVLLKAVNNYVENNIDPVKAGLMEMESNDSNCLARIVPVILYAYEKKLNDLELINLVNNITSLTNRNEISKLGCFIYAKYVLTLLKGFEKKDAYYLIRKYDYYKYYSKEAIEYYDKLLINDISLLILNDIYSSDFIVDTLESMFWVILNTDTFKQSIIGACNLGDNTNTIGALVGSIAGLLYKYDNIPLEYINELQRKDYLINMINDYEMEVGI